MNSREPRLQVRPKQLSIDTRLAAYLAGAGTVGAASALETEAAIVANTTEQPFGINQSVSIDFNNDGQVDFKISNYHYNLDGNDLTYLQLDKNDQHRTDWTEFDHLGVFPTNGTDANGWGDHYYLAQDPFGFGDQGAYPAALQEGDIIGGTFANSGGSMLTGTAWDWQETNNFQDAGTYIRANRLIDGDMMQMDASLGRPVTVPFGTPAWTGLEGEVRYLGVRLDLNDAGASGLNANDPVENPDFHEQFWYGWIGVRIDNEQDATGAVVGYAYQSQLGEPILAGDIGDAVPALPGDFNQDGQVDALDYVWWRKLDGTQSGFEQWRGNFGAEQSLAVGGTADLAAATVPEPASLLMTLIAGAAMVAVLAVRRCGWLVGRARR